MSLKLGSEGGRAILSEDTRVPVQAATTVRMTSKVARFLAILMPFNIYSHNDKSPWFEASSWITCCRNVACSVKLHSDKVLAGVKMK